jgi:CheY-like chemotaxis protein
VAVQSVSVVIILVVEDDHLIQEVVSDALSHGGFEIAAAAIGEEAITLLEATRAGIEL